MRLAFGALGVGLAGNENVYFATVVRFNEFAGALVLIRENEELYNDIVNTLIKDIKEMWDSSADVNAFLTKVNRYSKYRIMPFSIPYVLDDNNDKEKTLDKVAEEARKRCIKFFKQADIFIKDANVLKKKDKKEKEK